jgi:tetratricopeptide (TPR) repeat protein
MMKRLPYLFAGWMWFSITITPVIGIIQISATAPYAMADRYHYLPSIGLAMMMAWGIPAMIKSEAIRKKLLIPAGVIFLAILSIFTWQQRGYWKNSFMLFSHALKVTENNWFIHNSRGSEYIGLANYSEAIKDFNRAIEIKPDYADAFYNRGIAYSKLGQHQRAIENYIKAIHLKPHDSDAYYNRGNSYAELGQHQRAIEDYNQAIQLKPDYADAYNTRAKIYTMLGQYQHAIEDYNKAISIKQDYADAYYNRGVAYLLQGNKELGCPDAQKACELGICKALDIAKSKGDCR